MSPASDAEPDPTPESDRRAALLRLLPRYVPIVGWLPRYQRADLGPDVLGGLTSWGVMVPVALAYASLAGLPPEYGLITAFAALAAYAVFGTSRHLRVTTSSTMAVMSLSLVAPLAGGDTAQFIALSAALALMVGALLVIAGLARLGFISEFLAKPVVTGFVFGVAVTIIVGQMPKLLGIPGTSGSVFDQLRSILQQLPDLDPLTLAVGALSLLLILVLQR
ncbi:MAG TPA: SulP family inorganic anion transporter, partial [Anaerolineae bacterium]|nr:SulP family inorganic anion transporter [Anaerolineae bacterium]